MILQRVPCRRRRLPNFVGVAAAIFAMTIMIIIIITLRVTLGAVFGDAFFGAVDEEEEEQVAEDAVNRPMVLVVVVVVVVVAAVAFMVVVVAAVHTTKIALWDAVPCGDAFVGGDVEACHRPSWEEDAAADEVAVAAALEIIPVVLVVLVVLVVVAVPCLLYPTKICAAAAPFAA